MPAFIVHDLPQAIAALTAAADSGHAIALWSPPEAARSLGAGYFLAMIAAARQVVPAARSTAVLDCGEAPGLAMAALRGGAEAVHVAAALPVLANLAAIAGQQGARLEPERLAAFDLGGPADPLERARAYLSQTIA